MGRIALAVLTALLLLSLLIATPARADDVDVALVLVTDVSRSIDDSEFALEKNGYASAFVSQKVLEAIQGGPTGRIAVAYVEFASSFEVRTVRGEVMAKQLARRSARRVELKSLNPEHPDRSFDLTDVTWIHRIIWASQ